MATCISTIFLLSITLVSSQNDFIGRKYSSINNVTTIDMKKSSNVEIVLSPSIVKYAGNPLFGQDKAWEPRIDNGYPNVVHIPNNGNKTWQLWYDDFITNKPTRLEGTLYAQSTDGINWIKPNLGLVEFNGSKENNIVLSHSGGVGIFKDIYTQNVSETYKGFGVFPWCAGTAVSEDGLHWSKSQCLNKLNNRYDTHNNMFYDLGYPTPVDKYWAITRGPVMPRTVAVSKSQKNNFDSTYTEADVVETGGSDNQTYAQITFEYYNIFLGLVMLFDSTSSNGRVYCELSWSPNMYDWYRVNPGQELIPLAPMKPVTFDSYVCFAAAYPVVVDDVVRLYYFGGNGPHNGDRNESFAMATIRMDGFAGLTNTVKGQTGNVQTHSLKIDGKYLCVTVDVNGGSVKVGLDGVNGFELSDSNAVQKNVTDYTMTWQTGNDLSSFVGRDVVIQFELIDSVLYTFQFANTTSN